MIEFMLFRPPIGGNLNSIFLVGDKKIKQVNFEGGRVSLMLILPKL